MAKRDTASAVKPRSRAAKQTPAKPGLIRRLLLLISVAVIIYAFGPTVQQRAIALWDRPVNEVSIEGPFVLAGREHIAAVLAEHIKTSFWQLDLQQLQAILERDPWIDNVSISRRWPDRLKVIVVEQNPVARWGERGFVNNKAELVLAEDAAEKLANLPRLQAQDASLVRLMQNYQVIATVMNTRNLKVSQIELDRRGSWLVQVDGGVDIHFGRHQLQERMRRFAQVFDRQLATRWADVGRVDVRYDNGVAVQWRKKS